MKNEENKVEEKEFTSGGILMSLLSLAAAVYMIYVALN